MEHPRALRDVPDDELLYRLGELVARSKALEADLVAHIGEVDERRLYARQAFPSMFAYCTEALHLSEAEAYRRITVARAARKHELLLAMLRDGRLHLTGAALLAPLLTESNRESILGRAIHRTKRQIEELVAALSPQPDVPGTVRRLARRATTRVETENESPSSQLFPGRVGAASQTVMIATPPLPLPAAKTLTPLSPGRYKIQFTASEELRRKLERLKALMRSDVPNGDLAEIVERAVTEKLERLEARRFARTAAPRKQLAQATPAPTSRHVPAAAPRSTASSSTIAIPSRWEATTAPATSACCAQRTTATWPRTTTAKRPSHATCRDGGLPIDRPQASDIPSRERHKPAAWKRCLPLRGRLW